MHKWLIAFLAAGGLFLGAAVPAVAAPNPAGTGQPSVECGTEPDQFPVMPPGFSTDGFAHAETVYANTDAPGASHAGNDHTVSQYDVACFQLSSH